MTYVYQRSEPSLWTVGYYQDGKWEPESDWPTPAEAARRVSALNGGSAMKEPPDWDGSEPAPPGGMRGPSLLDELKAEAVAEARRVAGGVSSVKITLQRGTVDIAVHAYEGSDIRAAEWEALESYRRIRYALNQQGVDAFAAEVNKHMGAPL